MRAWEGQVARGECSGAGGTEEDSLPEASDIAASLGHDVLCNISDGQRARESLLAHRRKHVWTPRVRQKECVCGRERVS